ncbi:MAG: hypothetical protein IJ196_03100 [Prevotella sp.]|nr:hypothetical protein [Prevotella sp.]
MRRFAAWILLSVLSFQHSIAIGKQYVLRCGEAEWSLSSQGISLVVGDVAYESVNQSAAVTLEVDGHTVTGSYEKISRRGDALIAESRITAPDGSQFLVTDTFSVARDAFVVSRGVKVLKQRSEASYFNSYFGISTCTPASINDYEFFVPGIWYRDNRSLTPTALASHYADRYFYFREDRLPLPVIAAREKTSGLTISLFHLQAFPSSFYGESGLDRIVDERMQFGSLGFTETGSHSMQFVFPGIEGERTYVGGRGQKTFAYRSHPVREGFEQHYRLAVNVSHTPDFPVMVEAVWKTAWETYSPEVRKISVRDAYEASIEVLDRYLLNQQGASGWPFSIYLPNGMPRAYNYQMGFIGFQISNAYFLLRYGLETHRQELVDEAAGVIDFWVGQSQKESGLVKTWADAYADRPPTWRDYPTFMRVTAGGMEGMMGAWNAMHRHGYDRPSWLVYCKRFADWLEKHQEPDGSFQICYDWKTEKPAKDSKYTTTNIIRFLVELYCATGEQRYLDVALRAGRFSLEAIHRDYLYVGGVIDNPNVRDRESGQMALYAFLSLYDVTQNSQWLDAAIQAARYTETFMFAYKVPMLLDDHVTDFPRNTDIIGQTLIATGHSAVDNGMAFSSFQYYRLYLLTGDSHFLSVARLIQNNTLSIMDLDGSQGYRYRGLLTECFNPQANRGHSVRQQLPWNQASVLDPMHRFLDAFGELDIDVIEQWPLERRLRLVSAYAATQGMARDDASTTKND